ncbi:hypothetical protein OG713_16220 [Streptomyces sp. NBC_00723]|uniref:hypothetical protein n=1 Tax=Streptomyces sp. NBC_00723 TaxID=2903673 RepID=UPI00386D8986
MGERLNDGAGHSRRRTHPVDAAADHEAAAGAPEAAAAGAAAAGAAAPALEALLVRALSSQALSSQALHAQGLRGPGDGERRAVAAFRAARDAGAHKARTRRRDDWRPRDRRHTVRSLRATLSVLVAGLTLGGVAFAAVGSSTDGVAGGAGRPEPAATTTASASGAGAGSADTVSVSPQPPAATGRDRPVSAEDTDAHCRAYEKVVGRGKATDSTAWQRLVTAAGGAENVVAYCEAAAATSESESGSAGGGPKSGTSPKTDKTAEAGSGAGKTQKAEPAAKAGKTPEVGQSAKATKAAKSGAESQ